MFNTCCCVYIYLSVCVLSCVLRLLINKRASADKLSDEKMVIQNSSLLLCVTSFIENLFSFFFFPSFSFLFFLLLFLSFWLFMLLMDNSPHLLYPTHSLFLLLLLLLLLAEETYQRDRDVSERKTRKNNI